MSSEFTPCTSILSVGTSVPRFSVDNRTSANFAAHNLCVGESNARKVRALYRRSGIERRGSVLLEEEPPPDITHHDFYPQASSEQDRGPTTKCRNDRYASESPPLALQACRMALQRAGVDADTVTHLVTVSCTGFHAPGVDVSLIRQLELPASTERIHVGFMGCHGAINGLRAANGLVAARPNAKVLVCSVELCSLHLQYGMHPDRVVSNALFADGAGAFLLQASTATDKDGSDPIGLFVDTGSWLVADSTEAMTWRIGDHGFEMTLSPQVPNLIEQHLRPYVTKWLQERGESIESIGGWAVHPGGPRILRSVEGALELPDTALEISRRVLSQRGNMSSATMAFLVDAFVQQQQPKPWLLMGFGPGLMIELVLVC